MSHTQQNVDQAELNKFNELATGWWDPEGSAKPLHELNPIRVSYIASRTSLQSAKVIDIGCGGGILSEALAKEGAQVTAVDMAEQSIQIAQLHAIENGLDIDYQQRTAEDMAANHAGEFDAVTCLEMLEHVPDPSSIIQSCADLVKPQGDIFFSTLNRHPKAYLLAVLGAEYVMNMLPKGTHEYSRFIRPSELASACRQAGLIVRDIRGITYHPLTRKFELSEDVKVNYLVHCQKA
jgi:2-polyprenyl-6-hydroxyphenyl methylase/3-demethylubiquinone-9 3-methyltransferase